MSTYYIYKLLLHTKDAVCQQALLSYTVRVRQPVIRHPGFVQFVLYFKALSHRQENRESFLPSFFSRNINLLQEKTLAASFLQNHKSFLQNH